MVDLPVVSRAGRVLLLVGLLAFLLTKAVLPAFTEISSDFPANFTAAKIVSDGLDPARLYDGAWFREQIRRYGIGKPEGWGEFTPYPPPTALVLTPLTGFAPQTALRILTVVNLVCLLCSMLLLSRIAAWRLIDSALFVLLSGWALRTGLRFGQPYILISTFCLLGYYLYLKRRLWLAGLCLGVFVPVKYYPLVVLAGLALQRQWRVVMAGGIAIAAVVLVSIGVMGWRIHEIFLVDVLFNHLSGHLTPIRSYTAQFQSFDTLFSRLFIPDPVRNPHAWIDAPLVRTIAVIGTKILLVSAAAVVLIRLVRGVGARATRPTIGILGILTLLIAPYAGTYAFALLWLPVALLIEYFLSERARVPAYLILGAYVLIGFMPYGHTYPFEGRGALTVLAYPRLFVLLAMFVVSLCAVAYPRPVPQRTAPLAA
ncbi:MAG: hypothetical protein QOI59_489 [Gammaproteobacteria bacterium]|jgi:hypothetical protein|nr:hypothetical protein [Gammaproteobacteria bacterium]